MDEVGYIVRRLHQTIDLEGIESIDALAGYIVGDMPDLNSDAQTIGMSESN